MKPSGSAERGAVVLFLLVFLFVCFWFWFCCFFLGGAVCDVFFDLLILGGNQKEDGLHGFLTQRRGMKTNFLGKLRDYIGGPCKGCFLEAFEYLHQKTPQKEGAGK